MVWLKPLITAAVEFGVFQLLTGNPGLKKKLGRSATGVAVLLAAGWTVWAGAMAILAGLFFFLADLERLVEPALVVGTIAVAGGVVLGWKGWNMIRH